MIDNKNIPLVAAWISTLETKGTPMRANNIIDSWCTKNNKVPYVIINNNGNVIGVDQNSGGYPWVPTSVTQWRTWYDHEEAERYRLMFDKPGGFDYGCALPWKVITLYEALGIEE